MGSSRIYSIGHGYDSCLLLLQGDAVRLGMVLRRFVFFLVIFANDGLNLHIHGFKCAPLFEGMLGAHEARGVVGLRGRLNFLWSWLYLLLRQSVELVAAGGVARESRLARLLMLVRGLPLGLRELCSRSLLHLLLAL